MSNAVYQARFLLLMKQLKQDSVVFTNACACIVKLFGSGLTAEFIDQLHHRLLNEIPERDPDMLITLYLHHYMGMTANTIRKTHVKRQQALVYGWVNNPKGKQLLDVELINSRFVARIKQIVEAIEPLSGLTI